ncbi:alkaline shock response membrane anchor protein AmaP [Candidatus Omnitrophota bacterium]
MMRILNAIIILFILLSAFLGTVILGFSLHLIELNDVIFQLNEVYNNLNARIGMGATGIFFILLAMLFAQVSSSSREREKTIAFNNPSGQVTITLFAVEDLIRRMGQELPQVKEIKPDVKATKKRGIQIRLRLVMKSEINIPEFTAQLQEMVKSRIREIFGIDEQIVVKIHVAKIVSQQEKAKRKSDKSKDIEEEDIQIPYQRA